MYSWVYIITMDAKQIKVTGLKELQIAMALINAGGSDEIKPPQDVLTKAFAKLGNGKGLAVTVVDNCWVVLRGKWPGLTIYHFYTPVTLV